MLPVDSFAYTCSELTLTTGSVSKSACTHALVGAALIRTRPVVVFEQVVCENRGRPKIRKNGAIGTVPGRVVHDEGRAGCCGGLSLEPAEHGRVYFRQDL